MEYDDLLRMNMEGGVKTVANAVTTKAVEEPGKELMEKA